MHTGSLERGNEDVGVEPNERLNRQDHEPSGKTKLVGFEADESRLSDIPVFRLQMQETFYFTFTTSETHNLMQVNSTGVQPFLRKACAICFISSCHTVLPHSPVCNCLSMQPPLCSS